MGKPKIRFEGYTDDWEQRKVCNITTSYSGGTPKSGSTEYYDGDIPFIRSGEIYSDKTELFITELGMKNSSAKMVHEGDILYALYGATSGEVSRAKLDGAINQAILAIIPNDDINANFLVEWFRKEKDKITDTYLQGGQGNLSAQIIKELEVTIPSYDEQNKIGLYFEQLNNLITLHQRKCDETQKLKKYMLQKMFPQNGKKVPEIRFSGFTDDWEQRKVGDYLTESREIGNKGDVAHKMTVKLWGKGVYEKLEVGSTNTQYFIRHANQFIYSKLDFLNCAFGVVPEELESLETTADVPAFDCVDMNPYFMFYRAIQPSFYIQNGIIANGSRKAKRIHADTFLEMPISVPELTEQNKIVEYFQSLDDLITLHQRKCDELRIIKKFMLQNMFV